MPFYDLWEAPYWKNKDQVIFTVEYSWSNRHKTYCHVSEDIKQMLKTHFTVRPMRKQSVEFDNNNSFVRRNEMSFNVVQTVACRVLLENVVSPYELDFYFNKTRKAARKIPWRPENDLY